MAIGIGNSVSTRSLRSSQEALQKTLSQLSSAKRITQAGDDAAGLAISEKLRATERSFQQAERNLSDGISVLRTAEGGFEEASGITRRLRELSIQAQNGTVSEEGQQAIQAEFDQLTSELTRIAEATQFNGRTLLNGEASGAGAIAVNDGNESGSVVEVSIPDVRAGALGLDGLQARDGATLDQIDQALSSLSSARGDLGAADNRLRSAISNVSSQRISTAAANSRIADADFAQVTADQTKNALQRDFATSVQAQANISAGRALALLS